MSLSAFLFDVENIFFDGTYWHRWVHQQAVSLGASTDFNAFLSGWRANWLPRVYSNSLEYWDAMEAFLGQQSLTECQVLELVISARSRQREVIRNCRPLPGIQDCLSRLKRSGKKIGVICNSVQTSQELSRRLSQIGIHTTFDFCMTSRSAGRQLPDNNSLQEMLQHLQAEPNSTAYVSASTERIEIAQLLGLKTIQIDCPKCSVSQSGLTSHPSAGMRKPHADFRFMDINDVFTLA